MFAFSNMQARSMEAMPRWQETLGTTLKTCAMWLLLRSLLKCLLHLFTGKCELERITRGYPAHRLGMISLVRHSLALSKTLPRAKRGATTFALFNASQALDEIREVKGFSNAGLSFALQSLRRSSVGLVHLEALMGTAYDTGNTEHVHMIDVLWSSLVDARQVGDARDWTLIGFQTTRRPETDFRGGGLLSLHNLVFFCSRYNDSARRVLREQCGDVAQGGFPFAITGINLTFFAFTELVKPHKLDALFEQAAGPEPSIGAVNERSALLAATASVAPEANDGEGDDTARAVALDRFNVLYAVLFRLFAAQWRDERPADAMQFPLVFRRFKERVFAMLATREGLDTLAGRAEQDL